MKQYYIVARDFTYNRISQISKPFVNLNTKVRFKYKAYLDQKSLQNFLDTFEDKSHREIAKSLFENALKYSGSQPIRELYLELSKRVITGILQIQPLVGIQTMSAIAAPIYSLRYMHGDNYNDNTPDEGRRLTLQVVVDAVLAKVHELQSGVSLEALADVKTLHGDDAVSAVIGAVADEAVNEVINGIVHKVKSLATVVEIPSNEFKSYHINYMANDIARDTRRGAGNVIVVNCNRVKSLPDILGEHFILNDDKVSLTGLTEVGTFNSKTMTVYSTTAIAENEILVAYKGRSGETDAGYTYCPFKVLESFRAVVDPLTFIAHVKLATRYGEYYDEKSSESDIDLLSHVSSYYKLIKLTD